MSPDFKDILSEFIAGGVEFLLVGAHAMAAHGLPRATGDLDLWVRRDEANAARVFAALARFGAPLGEVSVADFQTLDLVFQMGVPPHRIDVLTTIDGVEFDEAWAKRTEVHLEGLTIPVLGREQLLRNKRATGRAKDALDADWLERKNPAE